jgi:hypothetical protein
VGWTCSKDVAGKKISRKCWSESLQVRYVGEYRKIMCNENDPSGRAVQGVSLGPLACWDCGFETRQGHRCLLLVGVACCPVEACASG